MEIRVAPETSAGTGPVGAADAADAVDPVDAAAPVDGRRARRARNREAVVDAMLDLVLETGGPPTVEAVAERAGVSVASLFRYVESLDELRSLAGERCIERFGELFEVALGGTLPARIDRLVRQLCRRYEQLAPLARLVRARSYDLAVPSGVVAGVRLSDRRRIESLFAPELDALPPVRARAAVDAIAAITSFESWELLQATVDRSRSELFESWSLSIDQLLSPG